MGANSVTGVGQGAANTLTSKDLAILANGPSIIFMGIVSAEESLASSPPLNTNVVVFPYALEGGADDYVVMLTTINAGLAYIADRDEDGEGNFTGFTFVADTEGDVMYLVAKVGIKPQL